MGMEQSCRHRQSAVRQQLARNQARSRKQEEMGRMPMTPCQMLSQRPRPNQQRQWMSTRTLHPRYTSLRNIVLSCTKTIEMKVAIRFVVQPGFVRNPCTTPLPFRGQAHDEWTAHLHSVYSVQVGCFLVMGCLLVITQHIDLCCVITSSTI